LATFEKSEIAVRPLLFNRPIVPRFLHVVEEKAKIKAIVVLIIYCQVWIVENSVRLASIAQTSTTNTLSRETVQI